MSVLIDTNVLSELRKGPRCNPHVRAWFGTLAEGEVFLSVVTIGEIRKGITRIRRRDARSARALAAWLDEVVRDHASRILPVDIEVTERWGEFGVPDPVPVLDGFIAATALVHGLTVATRNTKDIARTGAKTINPFTVIN